LKIKCEKGGGGAFRERLRGPADSQNALVRGGRQRLVGGGGGGGLTQKLSIFHIQNM